MTQKGVEEVIDTLYMKFVNESESMPYRVGNVLVSSRHLIYRNKTMYYASDIGEKVEVKDDVIHYYHLKFYY